MAQLTQREREVVRLLASGRNQRQIAAQLHVSYATIKAHVSNARQKTGAQSALELAVRVAAEGDSR
jgi:DNA-binding NarL/FixJ family response regulator